MYRITVQALDGGLPLVSGVSSQLLVQGPPSMMVTSPSSGDVWYMGVEETSVS